jgi:hypothetical protein
MPSTIPLSHVLFGNPLSGTAARLTAKFLVRVH